MRQWLIRVLTGIIFMAHGWQKLFQMGLHGTAGMFGAIGVPAPAVSSAIVTFVELLGGLALIIGLLVLGPIIVNILCFHIFLQKGTTLFDAPLIVICVLALYLLFQRWFVSSVISSGVKG